MYLICQCPQSIFVLILFPHVLQHWIHVMAVTWQVKGKSIASQVYYIKRDNYLGVLWVLPIWTWRHVSHVGDEEQKHFSLLGTKLHFQVNSSRKNSIVLTTNMAALLHGCKPGISSNASVQKLGNATFIQWMNHIRLHKRKSEQFGQLSGASIF